MKTPRILATTIALLLATTTLHAQTWDGGGTSDSLLTAANWNPDGIPGINANVIFAGNVRLTPNVSSDFQVNSLTFNNTAGAFVFGGVATLSTKDGGLTNNDTDTQTFNNLMNFGLTSVSSINTASGALVLNGGVSIGNATVTLTGASALTFGSTLTGAGTITKTGTGAFNLASTATAIGADFNLNGGTTTLSAGTTQTFSIGSVITMGGGNLTLNESAILDGGQLTRTSGTLSIAAGKTLTIQNGGDVNYTGSFTHGTASTITVTGAGSTFNTTSTLSLSGGSTFNVLAGASASAGIGQIFIANTGNGTVTVDGAGSSLGGGALSVATNGNTGALTFSNGATGNFSSISVDSSGVAGTNGTLNIQSGAAVSAGSLALGTGTAVNTGATTITGAGSSLTVTGAGTTTIGAASASTATFNMDNGAFFHSGTGAITVNARGTITVNNGATFNANSDMTLNGGQLTRGSAGIFNLAAGKTLTVQNGGDAVFAGTFFSTGGNITVSGSGSTLQGTGIFFTVSGGSTTNISAGGMVSSAGNVYVATSGNAVVTVDGSGSSFSGNLLNFGLVGNTGTMTFSNGAAGAFGHANVGCGEAGTSAALNVQSGASFTAYGFNLANFAAAATGTVLVTGVGSTFTLTGGDAFIGASSGSTATVNIQNGGTFNSTTGTTSVGATGVIALTGGGFGLTGGTYISNGNLTLSGQLTGGAFSAFQQLAGTFTVTNGGDATFGGTTLFQTASSVVVTGAGSTLTTDLFSGTGLVFNNASLAISAGGVVIADTFLHIGIVAPTSVTVDGAGSQLQTYTSVTSIWGGGGGTPVITFSGNATGNFGFVALGLNGNTTIATLNIQSGADVTMFGIAVANTTDTTQAIVNVGGAGSTFTANFNDITLGAASGSTATLNITSGGTVTTVTTVSAGDNNNLILNATGTVNLNGGSLILGDPTVRNGGVLNFNSGLLSLDESLTVGATGLLGGNLTLASVRNLTLGATHTTTIEAFNVLTLNGGTLRTGALTNNGTLDFIRGTLAITGAGGFNIGTGALGANVTLSTGANLQVTNTATVASGGSLTVDGGSATLGVLNNNGVIEHLRGTLAVTGAATNVTGGEIFATRTVAVGGAFTNQFGARVTLQNGTGRISGAGTMTNAGLITGDGTVAMGLTNISTGDIRAESGRTLYFTGGAAANSGDFILQGGTLDFASAVTNSATGFISGRGALHTGGITNSGVMAFSGGTTDIRGDLTNSSGGRIVTSGGGATTTFFDDVAHNGTEIHTGAGASSVFFGALSGAGPFTGTGTVYSNGDLRPGNSPATVSYGGSLVLGSFSTTTMEIGGLSEGAQYDSLQIASSFYADGILALALINGYAPSLGDMFDLFDTASTTGAFDSLILPALAQYLAWNTSALYTTGEVRISSSLTPIEQWRLLHFGTPANLNDGADDADPDGDGAKNLLEYALGLDPRTHSANGLPALSVVTAGATQHIALTITRPLSATDITYQIEIGGALISFLPGSSYSISGDISTNANTTQVSRINDGTFETLVIRDNTALTAATSRFLRLKVSNP